MTTISKVNNLCQKILLLTDEEIGECEEMANKQYAYNHPLKCATAGRYHDLGEHNLKVIIALKYLREVIKEGENIAEVHNG